MYKFILCLIIMSALKVVNSQTDTVLTSLKGFEDGNGITQLLYSTKHSTRSIDQVSANFYVDSTIFTYNTLNVQNSKTSFITKGFDNIYYPENHLQYNRIADIEFISNEPTKYIYIENTLGIDPGARITRYNQNYTAGILGHFNDLHFSSEDSNHIYAVAGNWIMQSFDAGLTWDDFSIEMQREPYIHYLTFSPFSDSIIFGCDTDQYLYKSNDTGKTFTKISEQGIWNNGTNFFFDSDQHHIYALIPANFYPQNTFNDFYSLFVSDNFGENSWQEINPTSKIKNICLDDSFSGNIYISTQNEIKKSTDYGQTFNSFMKEENIIKGIYKSTIGDFFVSMPNKLIKYDNDTSIVLKQFSITNALKYYPLHIGDICQYKVKIYGGFTDTIHTIAYRKVVGDSIMLNGLEYLKIIDETKQYEQTEYIRIDSSNGNVYSYRASGSDILVDNLLMDIGDEHPLLKETYLDNISVKNILGMQLKTKSFSPSLVITSGSLTSFEYSENFGLTYKSRDEINVVGTTYSYQLKYAKINGEEYGTLVSADKELNISHKFHLSQNYPNPFNPSTKIKYSIPNVASGFSLSNVQLKVYDILGKEVATLVNENQKAGNYERVFEASNLASGIYYYQLKVGDFIETKKMILLK